MTNTIFGLTKKYIINHKNNIKDIFIEPIFKTAHDKNLKDIFIKAKKESRICFFAEIHYSAVYDNSTVQVSLEELVGLYTKYCDGIVVATDDLLFKSSYTHLQKVRSLTEKHITVLDLFVNKTQIHIAHKLGADSIIMMPCLLPRKAFLELYDYARGLSLEVIIELQSSEDSGVVGKCKADVVGINNRDKDDLRIVDLEKTNRLSREVADEETFILAESGIRHPKDVGVFGGSADGVLVGSALLTNPKETEILLKKFSQLKL